MEDSVFDDFQDESDGYSPEAVCTLNSIGPSEVNASMNCDSDASPKTET